jgi:ABC-type transport system involved in cytochrome c biogenesis permease subunit
MHFAMMLLQSQPNQEQIQRMAMTVLAIMPILMLVGLATIIVPFWFILKKAGFSPWLALLNAVPLGSLILLYVLAFAEWKVAPVPQAWPVQPPYPPSYPPRV